MPQNPQKTVYNHRRIWKTTNINIWGIKNTCFLTILLIKLWMHHQNSCRLTVCWFTDESDTSRFSSICFLSYWHILSFVSPEGWLCIDVVFLCCKPNFLPDRTENKLTRSETYTNLHFGIWNKQTECCRKDCLQPFLVISETVLQDNCLSWSVFQVWYYWLHFKFC